MPFKAFNEHRQRLLGAALGEALYDHNQRSGDPQHDRESAAF